VRNDETIVKQFDYAPFGAVLNSTEINRTKFIGKEKDKESNYADHGVRKYDDEIGRFTSIDPLWEKYYSLTPYQYAGNNPVSFLDGNGKWSSSFDNLHKSIVNEAIKGMNLSEEFVNSLIVGENFVDKDQVNQFKHNMRSPGEKIENAQEKMENFINDNLEKFYNAKNDKEAGYYLGLATHPNSDGECEGHKGFQIYYGISFDHIKKDFDRNSQGYRNAVQKVREFIRKAMDEREKRIREAYEERVKAWEKFQELKKEP